MRKSRFDEFNKNSEKGNLYIKHQTFSPVVFTNRDISQFNSTTAGHTFEDSIKSNFGNKYTLEGARNPNWAEGGSEPMKINLFITLYYRAYYY